MYTRPDESLCEYKMILVSTRLPEEIPTFRASRRVVVAAMYADYSGGRLSLFVTFATDARCGRVYFSGQDSKRGKDADDGCESVTRCARCRRVSTPLWNSNRWRDVTSQETKPSRSEGRCDSPLEKCGSGSGWKPAGRCRERLTAAIYVRGWRPQAKSAASHDGDLNPNPPSW